MNKILQLIPADGWSAVFARRGEAGLEFFTIRLACWALVEEEVAGDTLRGISGFAALYFILFLLLGIGRR